MIRFQIVVPEDMHERLRKESYEKKKSIAQLVRDALDEKYPELIAEGKPLGEFRQGKE